VLAVVALACAGFMADAAAQFRVIAANGTILYDGPSTRANKLFVATANLPVEIITTEGAWARVRDQSGDLAWVERKSLAERRMVIVTAATIEARAQPDDRAAGAFQATQGVVLDVLDGNTPGWLRVRHRDGSSGFVRLREVWGQ